MKYLSKTPQQNDGEIHLTKLNKEEYNFYHNLLVITKRFLEKKQYSGALISEFVKKLTDEVVNFCKFFGSVGKGNKW